MSTREQTRARSILDLYFAEHAKRFANGALPDEVIVSVGSASRVKGLLRDAPELTSLDALAEALTMIETRKPRVMGKVREILDAKTALAKARENGATMAFDGVERVLPGLAKWLDRLAQDLGGVRPPFVANVYCTPPEAEGLGWHWDDHDVFVLHVSGSKRWQLMPRPVAVPVASFSPSMPVYPRELRLQWPGGIPGTPEVPIDVDMKPGTALFIPAGTWHQTKAAPEGSISVTIGRVAPPALDVLMAWLRFRLTQEPALRLPHYRALTPASTRAAKDVLARAAAEIDEFAAVLGGVADAPKKSLADLGPLYRRDLRVTTRVSGKGKDRVVVFARNGKSLLEMELGSDFDGAVEAFGSWLGRLSRPLSLSELAVKTSMNASTAYWLASTLTECGYLVPSVPRTRAGRGGGPRRRSA